jgi:hypothetical protein
VDVGEYLEGMMTQKIRNKKDWTMTGHLIRLGFFIAAWGWLTTPSVYAEKPALPPLPEPLDRPATLTFEELRQGIRKYYGRIQALEVEYDLYQVHGTQLEGLPQERDIVPEARRRFAMKGEGRYVEADAVFPGQEDQTKRDKHTAAYEGTNFRMYRPGNREGQIMKDKHRSIDLDFFAASLFLPISDDARASLAQTSFYLPYALDFSPEGEKAHFWSVRPKLESVDGAPCHVLESKEMDRIWVDPALGFAIRFRDNRHTLQEIPPSDWPLMQRIHLADYTEITPQIWLPKRVEVVTFAHARSPQNFWNRPNVVQLMTASMVKVNEQVPESLFFFNFPPGTMVTDYIDKKHYRVTGKEGEEMSWVVDLAKDNLPSQGRRSYLTTLTLFNLVLMVVLGGLVMRAWILRRRGKDGVAS